MEKEEIREFIEAVCVVGSGLVVLYFGAILGA